MPDQNDLHLIPYLVAGVRRESAASDLTPQQVFKLAEILDHHYCDGFALPGGAYLTRNSETIHPGEFIVLHFAGSPTHLKAFDWQHGPVYQLVRAGHQETHGAGSKSGTTLVIADLNGKEKSFRDCGNYSPEPAKPFHVQESEL